MMGSFLLLFFLFWVIIIAIIHTYFEDLWKDDDVGGI